MLSGALQRNAKHEARLSNISGYRLCGRWVSRNNQRFFSREDGIRMTRNASPLQHFNALTNP
jgi:hypothetical protein